MILFVIVISVCSLFFAVHLARYVLRHDTGTQAMQDISNAIKEGAEAFLARQNKTILLLAGLFAILIFVFYAFVRSPHPADPVPPLPPAFWTTLSFLFGGACSLIPGYIRLWVSRRANTPTAAA